MGRKLFLLLGVLMAILLLVSSEAAAPEAAAPAAEGREAAVGDAKTDQNVYGCGFPYPYCCRWSGGRCTWCCPCPYPYRCCAWSGGLCTRCCSCPYPYYCCGWSGGSCTSCCHYQDGAADAAVEGAP